MALHASQGMELLGRGIAQDHRGIDMKGRSLATIVLIVLAAGCGNSSAPAASPTQAPAPPKVAPTSASSSPATEIAPPTETLAPTQTLTPTATSTYTFTPTRFAAPTAASNTSTPTITRAPATWTPVPTLRPLPTAPAGGGGACCKHCGTTSKPCGDTCISNKFTCNTPPGCACP